MKQMPPRVFALLFPLLLAPVRLWAQEIEAYQPPDYIQQPAELPADMDSTTAYRLSVQDAIQMAVKNNLGIVLRREQLEVARYNIALSLSDFEPIISASYLHRDTSSPPSTIQEGDEGDIFKVLNDSVNLNFSQRFRWGTRIEVGFNNSRLFSSQANAVSPLLFRSDFGIQLTQPLLRGFSFDLDIPAAEILRAEISSESAWYEAASSIISTVRDTEVAYWDLVQALKNYQVQLGSLLLAEEQMKLTERQIDAGTLAPSDLIAAEATLAQRQLAMVQAERGIEQAADQLRVILNLPREEWSKPILPLDTPQFEEVYITSEEALKQALAHRPEVQQQRLALSQALLDTRVAANNKLPQLDAGISYGVLGQEDTYAGTLAQLFAGAAPAWTVFLNLTWTPLNRGSEARHAISQANERIVETRLAQLTTDLNVEVRAALRDLESAARQVKAAAKFRDLAERSLDAEQRKFLHGTSSNFFVAQRQDEFARARLAELEAIIQYQKAITSLYATMGTLLEVKGIDIKILGEKK